MSINVLEESSRTKKVDEAVGEVYSIEDQDLEEEGGGGIKYDNPQKIIKQ